MWIIRRAILLSLWSVTLGAQTAAEEAVLESLGEERPYHTVPAAQFENLGWELPDAGRTVKALADAAPGGAFDPRDLETLPPGKLGYEADWHELRYDFYGLDWDITGLHLKPVAPVPGLPTLVILHGGSSNWYEFFVDPVNEPGLGQYLAQKAPVLLVTIPGNYRHGGWTETALDERVPAYLLDREATDEELKVRNASYTFSLITAGVRQLVEQVTTGPVVVIGHSTAGEIPFMLHHSPLKDRMHGWILGWGSGGTSSQQAMQDRWGYDATAADYPPVDALRPRPTSGYAGDYLGPLNPVWDDDESRQAIADRWMGELEFRRRPHFKQPLQDLERRGAVAGLRAEITRQVRQVLDGNSLGVDPDAVVADLFAPTRLPLTGYSRMIWTTAPLDTGHWNADLEQASTLQVAEEFRRILPGAEVRVLLFDVPMTHYGHIERPRQMAGGLLATLKWLLE